MLSLFALVVAGMTVSGFAQESDPMPYVDCPTFNGSWQCTVDAEQTSLLFAANFPMQLQTLVRPGFPLVEYRVQIGATEALRFLYSHRIGSRWLPNGAGESTYCHAGTTLVVRRDTYGANGASPRVELFQLKQTPDEAIQVTAVVGHEVRANDSAELQIDGRLVAKCRPRADE